MADYLTWLDWYASGAADTLAKSGLPGAKSKMADDEALWVMCMLSLSQIDDADAPARLNWSDSDLAQYVFFGAVAAIAVSYTHLDVYKRQTRDCAMWMQRNSKFLVAA